MGGTQRWPWEEADGSLVYVLYCRVHHREPDRPALHAAPAPALQGGTPSANGHKKHTPAPQSGNGAKASA